MFKRNTWVVGLLLAVTMVFFGCIDPVAEPDGEGEVVVLFDLQAAIADVADGVIPATDDGWNAVFAGTPFGKCGNPRFSIATEGGKKVFITDQMTQTWGEGFDFYSVDNGQTVGMEFRAGDTIRIKGSVEPANLTFVVASSNTSYLGPGWSSKDDGGTFDKTFTLTTGDIATMRGAGMAAGKPVFRFHFSGDGGSRQGTIKLEELILSGNRSNANDVYIDDFEYSGLVQEKFWNDGVKITPLKGKTEGKITIYYKDVAAADEAANWTTDLADVQQTGDYDVKFDVAAAKGYNAATGLVAGVLKVLDTMPSEVTKTVSATMTEFGLVGTAGTFVTGKGKNWIFLYNNAGLDVTSAMPLAIQDFDTSTYPRVIFRIASLETDWQAFNTITFTYDLIKCSISAADSTNLTVRNNNGTAYDNKGGDSYDDFKEGEGQTITYPISRFSSVADVDGVSFQKNHGDTGVLLRFTKIELKY